MRSRGGGDKRQIRRAMFSAPADREALVAPLTGGRNTAVEVSRDFGHRCFDRTRGGPGKRLDDKRLHS
jgi:hypothetical protein